MRKQRLAIGSRVLPFDRITHQQSHHQCRRVPATLRAPPWSVYDGQNPQGAGNAGTRAQLAGRVPDDEPGGAALVAQLRALVARMTQVINDQRSGQIDSRAAAIRRQGLRRAMLSGPIAHLAEVGRMAAREVPSRVAYNLGFKTDRSPATPPRLR